MIENLKDVVKEKLSDSHWMDDNTSRIALEKVVKCSLRFSTSSVYVLCFVHYDCYCNLRNTSLHIALLSFSMGVARIFRRWMCVGSLRIDIEISKIETFFQ